MSTVISFTKPTINEIKREPRFQGLSERKFSGQIEKLVITEPTISRKYKSSSVLSRMPFSD